MENRALVLAAYMYIELMSGTNVETWLVYHRPG
jgi:hypothetical protein